MMEEIWNEFDIHSDNQQRLGLPTRLLAKTFVFRLLYGGTAYSYEHDPDFAGLGNQAYWEEIISRFYSKYCGIKTWHRELEEAVKRNGKLIMPTGRVYYFEPFIKGDKVTWPRTKILNYPVQGLGADIMSIARVTLWKRLKGIDGVKLINTVHDSIVLDIDEKKCDNIDIASVIKSSFNDVPKNFEKLFGVEFNLPIRVEIEKGMDWANMEKVEC